MFKWTIWLTTLLCLCMLWQCEAKPLKRGPPQPKPVEGDSPEDDGQGGTGLAYDSYLKQVVDVLESDPEFRKKLETANISDIKSGKIAMYLEMVNHTVRTSLDEIKRREMTRLQELARLQMAAMTAPGGMKSVPIPGHLDIRNQASFEMKDLQLLIKKTTDDLEELDKKRRAEFKEYEMEKEYEKNMRLNALSEEEKKKEEQRLEELKKKHAEHPKLNHPGSKDQFEEVWDKVDHLEDQEFNPKTFFFKHDVNGDMEWSIEEVDAVLQLELDKVYDARNAPDEDDPYERQEEMNRMREHVFTEMDKDHNQRISFEEFIEYTGSQGENEEFNKDEGWDTLEAEVPFSDDDYAQYINSHHAQPGVVHPPVELHFEPEKHQKPPQGQQFQQQQPPQQQQFHQQQPPQQQFQQQQPPQQQFHQQQPPQQQQQFHQQQPPQQQHQFQQQQPPQQQQQQFQQAGQVNINQGQAQNQVDRQQQIKVMQEQLKKMQEQQQQQPNAVPGAHQAQPGQ